VFLAFYGPSAQRIGWLFNSLAAIALLNAVEVSLKKRRSSSSNRRSSFVWLKAGMIIAALVAFICALLIQAIDDHMTARDGPFGSGDDWYPLV
jgi:predicted permease